MVTTRTKKVSTIMDESTSEKYARTLVNLSYDELIMAAFAIGRYEESDKTATSKLNDLIMRQGEMIDNDVHYQSTSSKTRLGTWLDYLNTQMDKVYENGYDDGHDDGYVDAYQEYIDKTRCIIIGSDSYNEGYQLGYDEGHDDGYIDATQAAMVDMECNHRDGYMKGHRDGYMKGQACRERIHRDGYMKGYADGVVASRWLHDELCDDHQHS